MVEVHVCLAESDTVGEKEPLKNRDQVSLMETPWLEEGRASEQYELLLT